jgi:hypothetical protein
MIMKLQSRKKAADISCTTRDEGLLHEEGLKWDSSIVVLVTIVNLVIKRPEHWSKQ